MRVAQEARHERDDHEEHGDPVVERRDLAHDRVDDAADHERDQDREREAADDQHDDVRQRRPAEAEELLEERHVRPEQQQRREEPEVPGVARAGAGTGCSSRARAAGSTA